MTLHRSAHVSDDAFDVIRGALHARYCHADHNLDCGGPSDDEDADADAILTALRQHGLIHG